MKPNILLITIDTLRADKTWGNNRTVKTPSIDSLINRGTLFTNAFATTSSTTPSLASILTGYYPSTHGIRSLSSYKLRIGITTLAQIFKDNGYITYAKVTGFLPPELGLDRGFDHYECRDKKKGVHSKWGEDFLETISQNKYEAPWFIFLHFGELHIPRWVPSAYYQDKYGVNLYEQALSGLDSYIGKLLKRLAEDTVIILTGDHGENIDDSRWIDRRSKFKSILREIARALYKLGLRDRPNVGHGFHVYDYLMHVPLILVGKPFKELVVCDNQISLVDLLPTLVEALNLKSEAENLDGRSLMPLLRDQKMEEIPIFLEACGYSLTNKNNWLTGVRTLGFKYVYGPYSESVEEELYDISTDPNEMTNLLKIMPEKAQELRKLIELHYRQEGDEFALEP